MKTPPAKPSSLALGEAREAALEHAAELVLRAWREFDQARDEEPVPSAALLAALAESLPEDAADVRVQLDLAAAALDTSIAQSRPRFLAYVGSSGLEIGALADLLAHSYDPNLAIDAGSATRIESQTIEWLAEFVGYPADCGFFTSGGTISNITALAAARERALPGSRISGVRVPLAVYCSEEVHYSVVRGA
jgi:aromatic-L-amino-acid decarboxylase